MVDYIEEYTPSYKPYTQNVLRLKVEEWSHPDPNTQTTFLHGSFLTMIW